jgi:hypothetical protein
MPTPIPRWSLVFVQLSLCNFIDLADHTSRPQDRRRLFNETPPFTKDVGWLEAKPLSQSSGYLFSDTILHSLFYNLHSP